MAVLKVKNDKGEFVDVPYFVTEGGGGTGGGSAGYELVARHQAAPFTSYQLSSEEAQKLADATEIYMYCSFGSFYGIGTGRASVMFRFAQGRSHSFSCVLEERESDAGTRLDWIVKIIKLDEAKYLVEDAVCANSYPPEMRGMRKFLLFSEMPFGNLPSMKISLSAEYETSGFEIPADIYIYAR